MNNWKEKNQWVEEINCLSPEKQIKVIKFINLLLKKQIKQIEYTICDGESEIEMLKIKEER